MKQMKNRVLSIILVAIMLISANFVPVLAFEGNMYSEQELLDYSQELAVFKNIGIFDVSRDVQDIVTRAEFTRMLNSFFGNTELATMLGSVGIFSDVKSG